MKVGYIGSSEISDFHITALQKNGFEISAIGTTKNSIRCKEISEKFNLKDKYCPNGWQEVFNQDLEAYFICIDINSTPQIIQNALEKGKPIFVEKPLSFKVENLEKFINHKNIDKIFVGYNRRFYKTARELKKFCEESKGGTILVNIPITGGLNEFIGNGCHIIDLLRFCIGDYSLLEKVMKNNTENSEIESISALCNNSKWNILINSHNLIPSNFSITVNSEKKVAELKPIEKFSLYQGMKIIHPSTKVPIRRYIPNLKYFLDEDNSLKPGFDSMYKNFKLFANKKNCDYCSFEDALETLKMCWIIIKSDLSNNYFFK